MEEKDRGESGRLSVHLHAGFIEFDATVPIGQFRTRMETFLETMKN